MKMSRWTAVFRDAEAEEPESMQVLATSPLIAVSMATRQVAKLAPDAELIALVREDVEPRQVSEQHRKRRGPRGVREPR